MGGGCFYVAVSDISTIKWRDIVDQTPNFDLLAGIHALGS